MDGEKIHRLVFKLYIDDIMMVKPKKRKAKLEPLAPDQKAMINVKIQKDRGLLRNEKEEKEYYDEMYKQHMASMLTELVKQSQKQHIRGIMEGALFSLFAGLFASSYIKLMDELSFVWAIMSIGFGCILLYLFYSILKNLEKKGLL